MRQSSLSPLARVARLARLVPVARIASLAALSVPLAFAAACSSDVVSSAGEAPQDPGEAPNEGDGGADEGAGREEGGVPAKDGGGPAKDAAADAPAGFACPAVALPAPACANGFVDGVFTSAKTAFANLDDLRGIHVRMDRGGAFHVLGTSANTFRPAVIYLTNRSGTWQREVVGVPLGRASEKIRDARLSIDACGQPTVVYLREYLPAGQPVPDSRAFLATRSANGTWSDAELAVPTSAADATPSTRVNIVDLAEEPGGALHVVANLVAGMGQVVLTRAAGAATFTTEHVGASYGYTLPVVTWSSTLGLVIADAPSIRPRITFKTGAVWTSYAVTGGAPLPSTGGDGPHLGVHADAVGAVHVAWKSPTANSYSGNSMYYARFAGGVFSEPITIAGVAASTVAGRTVGSGIRIGASAAGVPFVSHMTYGGPQWAHPTAGTPTGWTSHQLPSSGAWAAGVLDSTGRGYLISLGAAGLDLRTQACTP